MKDPLEGEYIDENMEGISPESIEKKYVLIVEDDQVASRLLEKLITKMKLYVRCYEDPVEALKDAKNFSISLLFLDIKLPNMTGLQFLEKLRIIQDKPEFPVIVMTGYTQKENVQNILKNNVQGLMTKPLDLKRAIQYIQAYAFDKS